MNHEEMLIYLDALVKDIDKRLKRLEEDSAFMSILKKVEEDKK